MRAGPWVASVCLAVTSCGPSSLPPIGSVLLSIDTDATLPATATSLPAPGVPPPLFDRMRVEVLPDGTDTPCDSCARDFDVNEAMFRAGVSLGMVPQRSGEGMRVRVRLYRSIDVGELDIDPDSTIDVFALLPVAPGEGTVRASVFLGTDTVGVPTGSADAPVPASVGGIASSQVGTWPGAAVVDCPGTPAAGEVCVVGGAYFMGNRIVGGDGVQDVDRLRLVVLSPFFLDAAEATVGALRAFLGTTTQGFMPWSGSTTSGAEGDYCTFGRSDALAMNCVTFPTAQAYCASLGKSLPSEAQFEYAATGLASYRYVWGQDEPSCSDGVYGRGPLGAPTADLQCHPATGAGMLPYGGVVALSPATRKLDQLAVAGGTIFDLAGNLSEWVADLPQRQDEPCWSEHVLMDPLCKQRSKYSPDDTMQSVRGGTWGDVSFHLAGALRTLYAGGGAISPLVGLRCARVAM